MHDVQLGHAHTGRYVLLIINLFNFSNSKFKWKHESLLGRIYSNFTFLITIMYGFFQAINGQNSIFNNIQLKIYSDFIKTVFLNLNVVNNY